MTIDDVDHFQRDIADIYADGRYESELPRAPDYTRDGRSPFAGAVGGAVSG